MHHKETRKEVTGLNRITKKRILELCRKDKLYQTPELNDVLYLHYQGFDCIECLEEYTELKCLWLESNAISEIQGLDKQTKLKCLFLQSNLIRKIENLEFCKELDTLNLSQNHIRKIENCGFEVLPVLNSLNLASNYLQDCEGLKELEKCKNLSVLDLSNNRIDDILVVKIFSKMPELKVLVLQGNPVVSKVPQYRKTLILECKQLTYLDSRPVFPKDRACAEAWKRGGYEEERKENERWNRAERKKMRDSVNATINLRNKHRKPGDEISLIPSSDSESDTEVKKTNVRIRVDSENGIDNFWDEVAEEKNFDSQKCESNQLVNFDSMIDIKEIIKDQQIGEETNMQENIEKSSSSEKELTSGLKRNTNESNLVENKSSNVDNRENFDTIMEAIGKITKSEDSFESSFNKHLENLDSNENNEEDNYEPLNELQETMKIFSQITYEQPLHQVEATKEKSHHECDIEQEYIKVNSQLKSDFEELSTNMSNFVNQLEREQEERQEVIKALFCKDVLSAKESSCDSSENENIDSLKEFKLERRIYQWDEGSKIKNQDIESLESQMSTATDTNEWHSTNSYTQNVCTEFSGQDSQTFDNKCNKVTDGTLPYIPMDISFRTLKSNESFNLLEIESKELKHLLQKLENDTQQLFKDANSEEKYGRDMREDMKENEEFNLDIKRHEDNFSYNSYINEEKCLEKADKEDGKHIVEQILDEIMQSFDIEYMQRMMSYEFPHDIIENNDEHNLSHSKTEVIKSITDVITSFNQFCSAIEINQCTKNKSYLETFDKQKQKNSTFKILSEQTNLQQFNSDTEQSLNAQLEEVTRNKHKNVRRVVDRVYAQKDRYYDTIELVDGKLMVRNHCTRELQELPQSLEYKLSDSGEDYDTAHSEEEDFSIRSNLRREQYRERHYKPASRKSSEDLIIKALAANRRKASNDDSDESNDEFYSLDDQAKPNLYSIDKEFLNKLTFDFPNLAEIDENHIVQCAKSYEELKHCMRLTKEERCLNEQDNELLENMIERKCFKINENPKVLSETLGNGSALKKADLLWFNKMSLKAPELTEQRCNDKYEKYEFENPSESYNIFGNVLEKQQSDQCLHENEMGQESIYSFERGSEQEKNEIENDTDFNSGAADTEILAGQNIHEIAKETFKIGEKEENSTNCTKSEDTNARDGGGVEILECTLEIIADNDEIVDTITVNAELHF